MKSQQGGRPYIEIEVKETVGAQARTQTGAIRFTRANSDTDKYTRTRPKGFRWGSGGSDETQVVRMGAWWFRWGSADSDGVRAGSDGPERIRIGPS